MAFNLHLAEISNAANKANNENLQKEVQAFVDIAKQFDTETQKLSEKGMKLAELSAELANTKGIVTDKVLAEKIQVAQTTDLTHYAVVNHRFEEQLKVLIEMITSHPRVLPGVPAEIIAPLKQKLEDIKELYSKQLLQVAELDDKLKKALKGTKEPTMDASKKQTGPGTR